MSIHDLDAIAHSYLEQYLQNKKVIISKEEAQFFEVMENYNRLIIALLAQFNEHSKYADIDLREFLVYLPNVIYLFGDREYLSCVEQCIERKFDSDADLILDLSYLKPDSFLKWPRFVLTCFIFLAMLITCFGFFAELIKVMFSIQAPYFYHWTFVIALITFLCWIPVLYRAFNKLKTKAVMT